MYKWIILICLALTGCPSAFATGFTQGMTENVRRDYGMSQYEAERLRIEEERLRLERSRYYDELLKPSRLFDREIDIRR